GVNWTRLKLRFKAWLKLLTMVVLAMPGTPMSSTWPRQSKAMRIFSRISSWPTMTLPTSFWNRLSMPGMSWRAIVMLISFSVRRTLWKRSRPERRRRNSAQDFRLHGFGQYHGLVAVEFHEAAGNSIVGFPAFGFYAQITLHQTGKDGRMVLEDFERPGRAWNEESLRLPVVNRLVRRQNLQLHGL